MIFVICNQTSANKRPVSGLLSLVDTCSWLKRSPLVGSLTVYTNKAIDHAFLGFIASTNQTWEERARKGSKILRCSSDIPSGLLCLSTIEMRSVAFTALTRVSPLY